MISWLASMHSLPINTLSEDLLRGVPEDMVERIPAGGEVVVTSCGKPVAIMACLEGEQADAVLRGLRRLRLSRPVRLAGDVATVRQEPPLFAHTVGRWQVLAEDCVRVLGWEECFEDAQQLACDHGVVDPVIMGTARGRDIQFMFVRLGPRV